jgi:hypothetical protein
VQEILAALLFNKEEKMRFLFYFSGGLLKQTDGETIRGVQSGVADVGFNPVGYRNGLFLNSGRTA